MVYTSGSSGRPKGVVARHQTVSHCVRWAQRAFSLSAADRSTWVSAPGFGVSLVNELWPMLATGCTVDLPDEQTLLFPDRLRDWLVNRGITVVQLVGTLAEPLCRQHWPPGCALRLLLATGERQDRWPPADLPFDLVVTYGCTETTHITSWRDDAAGIRIAPDGLPSPPVGRPVADTSVYLLDERGDPVAAGAVGEVYVAGPGLARAYLGDPALTAARWLPDPFAGVAGARMFRTGDLGRLLGDGSLALLGRVDRQVKVRGKRVNLDEVEAAVERQPGVTEAAVVPREHAGDVRLVGYLAGPAADRLPDLYRSLRAQLPDHQVPADLVPADRLPRTPNGKLDRHRLPEPTRDRAGSSARLTAPRGEIELAVADIWCELLDLAEIGTRDDFFELGGHSMIAVKMVSALQQRFGVLIDLPAFYDRPTVAGVAALVSGGVAA